MRRLLFVDDEQMVLDGLRSMLRPKAREWEMTFLPGGQEAIEEIDRREFDVVVSDMRMPRVDGAAVLKHVQSQQPNAVRIVLSGHTETDMALRSIPVAHQFLNKPCDAATIVSIIDRACQLQELLTDPALRSAIGAIGRLPSVPRLYMRINEALEKPSTSLRDVGTLIEQDMAVSAKMLQVVNSGFFGLPKRVTSIHTAVSFIGINMLRRVLLSVQAFESFEGGGVVGFSVEELQAHSHLTAKIATKLVKGKRAEEDAFTAGILHDIGRLIMATRASVAIPTVGRGSPMRVSVAQRVVPSVQKPVPVAAKPAPVDPPDEPGSAVGHGPIGAYLLGIWGLPYSVVEAVAYHHKPLSIPRTTFDVIDAVAIANVLAQEAPDVPLDSCAGFEPEYVVALGFGPMLPEWRRMARALASGKVDE
jgi:HD-like signal output (HDOD) protein